MFLAVSVFASTNVDDLLVVIAFFAAPKPDWRTIVAGQFIGIGRLLLASGTSQEVAAGIKSDGAVWFEYPVTHKVTRTQSAL